MNRKVCMRYFLSILFCLSPMISVLGFLPVSLAADCQGQSSDFFSDDLKNIVFVIDGKIIETEGRALSAPEIKADIVSVLKSVGIEPEITEEKESIASKRFLEVRIYSIMLERQVYFCDVKIIQQQLSQEKCLVREYSNVTSQAKNIRSLISDLMGQMVQDVR